MPLYVADSGGVRKTIDAIYVADSGGVRKTILAGYVADSGGVRRQFFNLDSARVDPDSLVDSQLSPTAAAVNIKFDNDGTCYTAVGVGAPFVAQYVWKTGPNAAGSYEIRATLDSGSAPGGSATGAWLALGTDRNWSQGLGGLGSVVSNLTIEIRSASTLIVLDSAAVSLECEVN